MRSFNRLPGDLFVLAAFVFAALVFAVPAAFAAQTILFNESAAFEFELVP